MTGKAAGSGDIKGGDIFRALIDFVILVLLVCGSGFGGYWYGIHERLAPVKGVAPGTPGALPPSAVTPGKSQPNATMPAAPANSTPTIPSSATQTPAQTQAAKSGDADKKLKFWVVSSGVSFVGSQVIISVNGDQVDNFFGPGKSIDISSYVKHGDNTITFDAKDMGEKYNKHKGDSKAALKLQLVKGAHVTDDFPASAVIGTYSRSATDSDNDTKSVSFTDGD